MYDMHHVAFTRWSVISIALEQSTRRSGSRRDTATFTMIEKWLCLWLYGVTMMLEFSVEGTVYRYLAARSLSLGLSNGLRRKWRREENETETYEKMSVA